MDRVALACLRCPHCTEALAEAGRALRCVSGHSFDIARHGYVNLLGGRAAPRGTDTAEMIEARHSFLAAGHYAPLANEVTSLVERGTVDAPEGCVVEVGAGTAYYLTHVMERVHGRAGLALDISVPAARRSARAHARIGAVVCDVWRELPVRSAAAAAVIDVFAPRNVAEFSRILVPRGLLVVATPGPAHLTEIVGPLGLLHVAEGKTERLEQQLEGRFALAEHRDVEYTVELEPREVETLVTMGPSAWHTDRVATSERIAATGGAVTVTVSARVAAYRSTT